MTQNETEVVNYLKGFKGQRGLYIIKPKNEQVLIDICEKLNYNYTSDIAYIGKAEKTAKSDLFNRAKQEMGWSNFEGATFVRKMGIYLCFDIKDKKNKELANRTKTFICSNFTIECIVISDNISLLEVESIFIHERKPCLNVKKNNFNFKNIIYL